MGLPSLPDAPLAVLSELQSFKNLLTYSAFCANLVYRIAELCISSWWSGTPLHRTPTERHPTLLVGAGQTLVLDHASLSSAPTPEYGHRSFYQRVSTREEGTDMPLIMHGNWTITGQRNAAFPQRFIVSGATSGNGTYVFDGPPDPDRSPSLAPSG